VFHICPLYAERCDVICIQSTGFKWRWGEHPSQLPQRPQQSVLGYNWYSETRRTVYSPTWWKPFRTV